MLLASEDPWHSGSAANFTWMYVYYLPNQYERILALSVSLRLISIPSKFLNTRAIYNKGIQVAAQNSTVSFTDSKDSFSSGILCRGYTRTPSDNTYLDPNPYRFWIFEADRPDPSLVGVQTKVGAWGPSARSNPNKIRSAGQKKLPDPKPSRKPPWAMSD